MDNETFADIIGMKPPMPSGDPFRDRVAIHEREDEIRRIRSALARSGWASPERRATCEDLLEGFVGMTYALAKQMPEGDEMRADAMEAIQEVAEDEPNLLPYEVARMFEVNAA